MRSLTVHDADVMKVAIQQEILRSEESRYDHKLHGVLLVSQGYDCYQVGQMFGQNPTTVQRWIKRFNQFGFSGLQDRERPGRPRLLDSKQWTKLEKQLRKSPTEFGHKQNLWDGKLLSSHLKEQFGVILGVRQCQRIFSAMGFRYRKPRPVIAKADETAQKSFKKTSDFGKNG
jgi:transposase